MFAVGFGGILMAATANTTVQLAVPDGLRGRVMSVYTTIFAGSTPIGGPVMGGIASLFGVAISLAVGGVLCLGDRRRRARLDAPQRAATGVPRQSVVGDARAGARRARRRPGLRPTAAASPEPVRPR